MKYKFTNKRNWEESNRAFVRPVVNKNSSFSPPYGFWGLVIVRRMLHVTFPRFQLISEIFNLNFDFFFVFSADTEVTTHQDILTCGSCQKPFPLGDIVKFIQHKILICNKENYSLSYVTSGETCDDNSDDGGPSAPGQPLGVVNSRRPSISAPINSKKSCTPNAVRLVCSPPATSPKIPEDEATTSTPKRRAGSSSPLGSKDDVENHLSEDELKPRIKQELDSGSSPDDVKKIRGVDAESNTTHSGKYQLL